MSGGLSPDNRAVIITGHTPVSRSHVSRILSSMLVIDMAPTIIDFESGQPKEIDDWKTADKRYGKSEANAPYRAPANVQAVRAARKAKKKMRKASRRK